MRSVRGEDYAENLRAQFERVIYLFKVINQIFSLKTLTEVGSFL